jgi:hypothetical protein
MMTFDAIGIVAVHRPNEIADRAAQDRMEAPRKSLRLRRQVHDGIAHGDTDVGQHRFQVSCAGHFADILAATK